MSLFHRNIETGIGIGYSSIYLGAPAGYIGILLSGYISIKYELSGVWQIVSTVLFSYFFSLLFWLLVGRIINKLIGKPTKELEGKEWFQ